jgi:septal ring factor EnvC (AmiA/AmiB activator)
MHVLSPISAPPPNDWLDEKAEREKRWAAQVEYIDELEEQVRSLTKKCNTLGVHISNIEHHIRNLQDDADEARQNNFILNSTNDELISQLHSILSKNQD